MSSLLRGFESAYDRTNQHFRQQENDRRYQDGLTRQKEMDGLYKKRHNDQMETSAVNRQYLQSQLDYLPTEQEQKTKLFDNRMVTQGLQQQVHQGNLDRAPIVQQQQDTEHQQRIAEHNLQIESGQFSLDSAKDQKKNAELEQRMNAYLVAGDFVGMAQDESFKDTDLSTIFNGVGRKAAIGLSEAISNQDWGSATQHFNSLYKGKLNKMVGQTKGQDGGMIRDVSALGFEVQQDGSVKIPVQVTTEKGTYTSYISQLRTGDKDDPQKQFSVDELIGKAANLGKLAHIFESAGVNEQMNQRATDYHRMKNPQKPEKGNWDLVEGLDGQPTARFNKNTGELMSLSPEGQVAAMTPEQLQQKREQGASQDVAAVAQQMKLNLAQDDVATITKQVLMQSKLYGRNFDPDQALPAIIKNHVEGKQREAQQAQQANTDRRAAASSALQGFVDRGGF